MRALAGLSLLLMVAACDAPPPRVDTAGDAARAAMDTATAAYAGCIDNGAKTIPADEEAAGNIALEAVAACKAERAQLVAAVAAFKAVGAPSLRPDQLEIVAEASVQALENDARQAAVVTVVRRQNQPQNQPPKG